MSDEALDVVERMFTAWEQGDVDEMLRWVAPGAEWHPSVWSGGMSYHGHAGVREWAARFSHPDRAISVRARELREGPSGIVVIGEVTELGGEREGAPVTIGWVFEVADGKVTRGEGFSDPDHALRIAGIWDF